VILAALGVLDCGVTLRGEITHDLTIPSKVMLKPFDAQRRAFWFRAARLPQQPDEPGALLQRLLAIARLTDLGAVLLIRTGANADVVAHGVLLAERVSLVFTVSTTLAVNEGSKESAEKEAGVFYRECNTITGRCRAMAVYSAWLRVAV
jgi:hypothetical protein